MKVSTLIVSSSSHVIYVDFVHKSDTFGVNVRRINELLNSSDVAVAASLEKLSPRIESLQGCWRWTKGALTVAA